MPAPRAARRAQIARYTLQLLLLIGAIVVALVCCAARAHAEDTPTRANAAVSPPTPRPATSTEGTDTSRSGAISPGSLSEAPRDIRASPEFGVLGQIDPLTAPNRDARLTPVAAASEFRQDAAVSDTAVAVAASGANAMSFASPAGGALGSGYTYTQAVDARTSIVQQVSALARGTGRIRVVQIGLVVDVGVAGANAQGSGTPVARGLPVGNAPAVVGTGSVEAVGARGTTRIGQSAAITNGWTAAQHAVVLTTGAALADSGLNAPPTGATIAGTGAAAAMPNVTTGSSQAIGDRSTSAITQNATVTASDHGLLTVEQRAVIVNIGVALANSGTGSARVGSLSLINASVLRSMLGTLFGGTATPDLSHFASTSAATTAGISTGDVVAIGNDTTTGIVQSVNGAVSGHGRAAASQRASATNVGFAMGNSGRGLASIPGLDAGTAAQFAALRASIASFLDQILHPAWLIHRGPALLLRSRLDLASGLLQVRGTVTGTVRLLAIPAGAGGETTQVSVEQVSGLLALSFAFTDGRSASVASAHAHDGSAAGLGGIGTALAGTHTGNVNAITTHLVDVCQSIGDRSCGNPSGA